jgi:tetratricopeptide (TPR) repeat protein
MWPSMMKHLAVPLISLFFVLAGGCSELAPKPQGAAELAPVPDADPARPHTENVGSPGVVQETLTGPLLFDILAGEMAGERGQLDVSVEHYLRAMKASADARVAQRALRVALYAKDEKAAVLAARRWVELAPREPDALQALATLELREGNEAGALKHLVSLIESSDKTSEAFQRMASLLANEQDLEAALRVMGALTKQYSQSAEAWLAYAQLAVHYNRWPLALSNVEQALALRRDWAEALILRATIQLKGGDIAQALAGLGEAVQQQPGNVDLRLAYARLLIEQKRYSDAEMQFEHVLKTAPDNADALYALALLAIDNEQLNRGQRYLRSLIEVGERENEAQYFMGRIEEQREDYPAAIDWYEKVDEGDYSLEAKVRAANLLMKQGDLQGARRLLARVRARDPRLALRLYLVEGDLLVQAGELEQAMALYNKVIAISPDNKDVLYARALLAEKLDNIAQTERDLLRILELDPENAHALNALGYTLADRTDRLAEALGYIQKALELAPDEVAIIDSMGWVQYRLGNTKAAIRYLRQAYEDSGHDGEIGAHLGEVLWVSGDQAGARKVWEQAREKNPDNVILRDVMSNFLQ